MVRHDQLRLPKQWSANVKSGVLNAIAAASVALVVSGPKHLPVIELRRAA